MGAAAIIQLGCIAVWIIAGLFAYWSYVSDSTN